MLVNSNVDFFIQIRREYPTSKRSVDRPLVFVLKIAPKGGESMQITQINVIRHLTKKEYFQLRELCFFSNCLYNFGLYNVRQQYFKDKTFLSYTKNEPQCKENENQIS